MADSDNYTLSPTQELQTWTEFTEDSIVPAIGAGITAAMSVRASFMLWLAATDAEHESDIRTYRDYYDGETEYELTNRMKEFLELDSNVKFDLNYLPIPVDVLVERLDVEGFETRETEETEEGEGVTQGTVFTEWWQLNRMDAVQGDVHHAAARDGDSYIIVGWDNERDIPTFSPETAYDGTNGMVVRYDEGEASTMNYAIKRWRIEKGENAGTSRMNVYTPDAIYKYVSGKDGWLPLIEPDESGNEQWPIPWLDSQGQPLGIPIAHFKNNSGGYDTGKSELKDLIPAQDALNKAVIDELAAADIEGFRIITLSGGQPPTDSDGNSTLDIGPGRAIHAPQGTWGYIPSGDLAKVSDIVDAYIKRMAQMSRTPLSYYQITGQIASGETQRADDTPLISKAENRAVSFGNAWEDAMSIARRLNNTFGDGNMDENVLIYTEWASFERVDKGELDRKEAETNEIKARTFQILLLNRVPREIAAKRAGYSDEEAAEMALQGDRVLPQDLIDNA